MPTEASGEGRTLMLHIRRSPALSPAIGGELHRWFRGPGTRYSSTRRASGSQKRRSWGGPHHFFSFFQVQMGCGINCTAEWF